LQAFLCEARIRLQVPLGYSFLYPEFGASKCQDRELISIFRVAVLTATFYLAERQQYVSISDTDSDNASSGRNSMETAGTTVMRGWAWSQMDYDEGRGHHAHPPNLFVFSSSFMLYSIDTNYSTVHNATKIPTTGPDSPHPRF